MTDVSVTRSDGSQALAARWQDFSRWWLAELRETVPPGWLNWVDGDAVPKLLVWRDRDHAVCRLASVSGPLETRIPLHRFGAAALDAWLVECGLRRDQILAGPVIGRDLFFLRDR